MALINHRQCTQRRSIRRRVFFPAEIISPSQGRMKGYLVDLSPFGARFEGDACINPNEGVILDFTLESTFFAPSQIQALARVVHARQHPFEQKFNLGLALTRIDPADALLLERALHGFPPIPPSPSTNTLSLEWVEVITRWEEDLGDRINIFEQSEWVLMAEENPPSPFPLTRRKGSLA